jgi:hypothetical protein
MLSPRLAPRTALHAGKCRWPLVGIDLNLKLATMALILSRQIMEKRLHCLFFTRFYGLRHECVIGGPLCSFVCSIFAFSTLFVRVHPSARHLAWQQWHSVPNLLEVADRRYFSVLT